MDGPLRWVTGQADRRVGIHQFRPTVWAGNAVLDRSGSEGPRLPVVVFQGCQGHK
jgi:hypothetical protein